MPQLPDGFEIELIKSLRNRSDAGPDGCPDVELLAAWMDRSLAAEAATACEAHLASCLRCQSIVATAVEATPADERTDVGPKPTVETIRPFAARRLLWAAAPFALAASMILAVWVARTSSPGLPTSPSARATQTADNRTPEASSTGALSRDSAAATPQASASQESRLRSPAALDSNPQGTTAGSPAPEGAIAAPSAQRAEKLTAPANANESPAAAAAPRADVDRSVPPESITVAAPSGRVSWNVWRDGRIFRVEEGQDSVRVANTGDQLLNGASASDNSAWVVGSAGAIWRTTDGSFWTRIVAPAFEDFIAVVPGREPDEATVTTASGERYTTRDAGDTWMRLDR